MSTEPTSDGRRLGSWIARTASWPIRGVFSFGFLDPRRGSWGRRGHDLGGWAQRTGLRYERCPVEAGELAPEARCLRALEAVPVRQAWHCAEGEREGFRFTLFDLRSECRSVAGVRDPVERLETFVRVAAPDGRAWPCFALWVFSEARPGSPEADAVLVARRWGGAPGGALADLVVDSCVASWRPQAAADTREVVLESHPGLFVQGADAAALRRLFGSLADELGDYLGWRVESVGDALLLCCDEERMPEGWRDPAQPGLVRSDRLDELLARSLRLASRLLAVAERDSAETEQAAETLVVRARSNS